MSDEAMRLDGVMRIPREGLRPDDIISIEETLTLEGPDDHFGFGGGDPKEVKFWEADESYYYVPRQWGRFRFGDRFKTEDRRIDGASAHVKFTGAFRSGQERFVNDLVKGTIEDGMGAIGRAKPGFGKTVCAASVIERFGRATLVIVPKKILVGQWVRRMETCLGITPGIVMQGTCEYEGRQVVIALVNSLAARDYGEGFQKYFGLIICDEVHRGAAPTWWKAIKQFPARYRVGLTATPRRGDGMFRALQWQVGPVVCVGVSETMPVRVETILWHKVIPKKKFFWNKKPVQARLVRTIARSKGYAEWLVEKAVIPAVLKGRQVLVLSDLLELLKRMHDYFMAQVEFPKNAKFQGAGYLVGSSGSKKKKTKLPACTEAEAQGIAALFGTWNFVSEGFDVETMSVLVFATPRADVEQAVGRIQRLSPGKPEPVVIDPRYRAGWGPKRFEDKRDRFYEEQKFEVFEA